MDDNTSDGGSYLTSIREDIDIYTGLAIGVGLQAAQELTDRPLFEDYMNPFNADKGVHAAFSYGLSGATYRLCEEVADRTEDTGLEEYGQNLRDPRYRAGLALGVVGVFTVTKELMYDSHPDGYDAAANYLGASSYILKDHHDIDSWFEEGRELGQGLYDQVRSDQ